MKRLTKNTITNTFLTALAVLSLSLFACSTSTEPVTTVPDVEPAGLYKIDYKTQLLDKADFSGIKNGVICVMTKRATAWSEKVEFGELVQVWIKNVTRDSSGATIKVNYQVELDYSDGSVLDTRDCAIEYDKSGDWRKTGTADATYIAGQMQKLQNRVKMTQKMVASMEGLAKKYTTGYSYLVGEVFNVINDLFASESQIKYQQIEAVMSGAVSYSAVKDMIVTMEAKAKTTSVNQAVETE